MRQKREMKTGIEVLKKEYNGNPEITSKSGIMLHQIFLFNEFIIIGKQK